MKVCDRARVVQWLFLSLLPLLGKRQIQAVHLLPVWTQSAVLLPQTPHRGGGITAPFFEA